MPFTRFRVKPITLYRPFLQSLKTGVMIWPSRLFGFTALKYSFDARLINTLSPYIQRFIQLVFGDDVAPELVQLVPRSLAKRVCPSLDGKAASNPMASITQWEARKHA